MISVSSACHADVSFIDLILPLHVLFPAAFNISLNACHRVVNPAVAALYRKMVVLRPPPLLARMVIVIICAPLINHARVKFLRKRSRLLGVFTVLLLIILVITAIASAIVYSVIAVLVATIINATSINCPRI